MPREKKCTICEVKMPVTELDKDGRCKSCRDARNASVRGVSYGYYMAMIKPTLAEDAVEEEAAPEEAPIAAPVVSTGRTCVVCGSPVPPRFKVTCGNPDCQCLRHNKLCYENRKRRYKKEKQSA